MPISKTISDLSAELATTRRFLERYPDGRGSWKPHEKSKSLSELASHVASIPDHAVRVLKEDYFDFTKRIPVPNMDSAKELLARFDASAAAALAAAESASDEHLEKSWSMGAGDHVVAKGPKRQMFRQLVLSHLIHHRAQLGVYYRLLGVPVPGSYGPSADETR